MPGILYSYSTPAPIPQAPLSSARNNHKTRNVTVKTQNVNIIDPIRNGILTENHIMENKREKSVITMWVSALSDGSYSSSGGVCLGASPF